MSEYRKITRVYEEKLLETLANFVAINSVYDEDTASEKDPFGKGVSKALNFICELAKKDGFKATNYDNKVVEILCGDGNKNITIMAHADVVPAASGWDQNPFSMVDHGDIITGRGVADDKGPLLAAYYAMKAVRDNHLLGNYQIRFLVGGNEESGSLGIEHYFHTLNKKQPDLGFSPDANYPLIFAEKGIINFKVKKEIKIDGLISLNGGVASNSVIEECTIKMQLDENFLNFLRTSNYKYKLIKDNDFMDIIFLGKAAHGASPELGINAGMIALKALAEYKNNQELLDLVKKYSPLKGEGINADSYSEDMGHNSLNVGLLSITDNQFEMVVNFRHVDTCNPNALINNIKKASEPFTIEVMSIAPLLYYSKDSDLVKILLNAYQEETGDYDSKPIAIGGGTYAKEADNIIAFGAEFLDFDTKMHSPGERARKEDLFKSISIYAKAIVDLGKKLDENKI